MTNPEILGALANLHEMLRDLVGELPEAAANRPLDPRLGCMSWQLAQTVYRETYWLREAIGGDSDLTERVRHLFPDPLGPVEAEDAAAACAQLPPPSHLVAWAAEIHHEHLRRLATPGALPDHPLLAADRLPWFLLQENARAYERLLSLRLLHELEQQTDGYRSLAPLRPDLPEPETAAVTQGHYRIGSRLDPFAYDNELPPQAVELSSFRIARRPVTNAQYLAFMVEGGYRRLDLWDQAGQDWRGDAAPHPDSPLGWRRDESGNWYQMGLNGPADLAADGPVGGINRHEARAFAAWTAGLGGGHAGAVVQHEYQWEVAARAGLIDDTGRVWEWCANPFHPYPDFTPFGNLRASSVAFERGEGVLRGASMHTQRCLRRASYRHHAPAEDRTPVAGTRLVYPRGD